MTRYSYRRIHEGMSGGTGVAAPMEVLPTGIGEDALNGILTARKRSVPGIWTEKNGCLLRLHAWKGEKSRFPAAGSRLSQEHGGDSFRILVIGDGTRKEALKNMAEELGIGRQIVFAGRVPQYRGIHYLHAADGFLFASKSETQGIVLWKPWRRLSSSRSARQRSRRRRQTGKRTAS